MKSLALTLFIIGFAYAVPSVGQLNTETWWINSAKVDCVGVGPMTCLQIQKSSMIKEGNWQLFYDGIEGFNYEPGFLYQIKVEVRKKKEPIPADASSLSYRLIEVISKNQDPKLAFSNNWKVIYVGRFQDPKSAKNNQTLVFEFNGSEGTYFGDMGCNTVRGGFSLAEKNGIRLTQGPSTMMACPSMEVENDMRKALEGIRTYKIENRILYLMDESGKNLMMLQAVD